MEGAQHMRPVGVASDHLSNRDVNDHDGHSSLFASLPFSPDLLKSFPLARSTLEVPEAGVQIPSGNQLAFPPVLSRSPLHGGAFLTRLVCRWVSAPEVDGLVLLPQKQEILPQMESWHLREKSSFLLLTTVRRYRLPPRAGSSPPGRVAQGLGVIRCPERLPV